ncbi:plasmid replication protein, CyRepA1 family [Cupriavidus oxalaticus]|uniref:Replication origin-binding protein domain-containing protein n=1 Tax=Cupriavidus oxalaticus TaxID=96344 RepID=A0A375G8U8_9BURK|nr:plasmid replication protein, CyRepA1 family [Cupriavidus oxalaticus]QRQ88187.1 hypothetical protein JTE91_16480 [Cupriavidus oxalaticus]QRQ93486.1 hypothetical protein JTE92_25780 [Cupriavidus oxalaticus]WQD82111.1 plasmid replication protein, CyRepA1 family [Cupriavidus oxalaticus]SPC14209.1 conserved hypothetical protein [Cupriavidus oxalaticus]
MNQPPSQHQPAASATFKIAINRTVKNKPANDDKAAWAALTKRFESRDLTVAELIDSIRSGYAFCAQHRNSRKSSNFHCMQVLAVDIDSGTTVDAALQSTFFQRFGSFIYTTVSHRPDAHRFRIVFVMEAPITDEKHMRAAYTGIIRKFGGDRSCNDACRMFFGAEACDVHFVGKTLPPEQVRYLIELGDGDAYDDQPKNRTVKDDRQTTWRSSDALSGDEVVTTAHHGQRSLADLTSGTRVFCPKHDDKHASAMVVTSKRRQNGVYCSACARTFWPPGNKREELLSFDFSGFEGSLHELAHEEHPFEWLDADAPPEYRQMTEGAGIYSRDSRYLAPKQGNGPREGSDIGSPIARDGVTFVRSPKGTGKTEWLHQLVAQLKAEGLSVLLIGHRQALLQSLAQRLGLRCYLDKIGDYEDLDLVKRHYAVCLDSLPKLNPQRHKFDVILIDESEQVYSHVTSSTLNGKREACFHLLNHYVQQAKRVVLSDADLGWLTVNVTDTLRSGKGPSYVYLNSFRKSDDHTLYMYHSREQLIGKVIDAVAAGGKQYVACNSKDEAKTITEALHQRFGVQRRIQLITSENSSDREVQGFIKSISDAVADCDVLIVSPALGTGIDISVNVEANRFTHVFGFFGVGITTHFDMDQQLARVRNMKEQHVWVSAALRFFEYEVDAIRSSLLANGVLPELLRGYTPEGVPDYDTDSKLLDVYAQVMSMRNASINNARKHFTALKQSEGWKVVEVEPSGADLKPLEEQLKTARGIVKKREFDGVANAKRITTGEYKALKDKLDASLDEQRQLQRFRIAQFYGVKDVPPELVSLDGNGRYRESVRLFSFFTASNAQRLWVRFAEQGKATVDMNGYQRKCDLLKKLFRVADVVDEAGAFNTMGRFDAEYLQTFIRVVEAEVVNIGLVLGVSVREDLRSKPMSQLSDFLRLIGLKFSKPKVRYVDGKKKVYSYGLDLDRLEQLQAYSDHYRRCFKEASGAWNPETGDWDLVVKDADGATAIQRQPAIA